MALDIKRALRSPGESIPFTHEVQLKPQEVLGDTVVFDPVRFDGQMTFNEGSLRLAGRLTSTAHAHCANCLEPASHPISLRFDEMFKAARDLPEVDPLDGDERLVYEGNSLTLDHLALSLALLELPMRLLCRKDCQGLHNITPLNDKHAGQKEPPDAHPFSALQRLLNKDQEV